MCFNVLQCATMCAYAHWNTLKHIRALLCSLLSKGIGEGAPLDVTDFHKNRGTFVDIIQPAGMNKGDFVCRVRRQWGAIADDTAAVLLAVTDPMEGKPMYVYTSKAMWMRTSVELRKLHPHERAAMMDATFKVSAPPPRPCQPIFFSLANRREAGVEIACTTSQEWGQGRWKSGRRKLGGSSKQGRGVAEV